jgi:hypothetical protein
MTRRVGPWPTIRNIHIASVSNEAARGVLRHSLFVIIAPMVWACGFPLRWARSPPYLLVHPTTTYAPYGLDGGAKAREIRDAGESSDAGP